MEKTILDISDVKNISPNLESTKLLDRKLAAESEAIVFDIEDKKLSILTTNNLTNQLKKIIDEFSRKWYQSNIFYTDIKAFEYAMWWYDQIVAQQQEEKKIKDKEDQAMWKNAMEMMKEVFQRRSELEPWKFVENIIKLAFQSWASDLHFQSEEKWVLVKLRIDGVLQDVFIFEHKEFLQYMQKIKFISGVKINITAIPQDGRFTFWARLWDKLTHVDARANFMPWILSENAVIRFLDMETWLKTFDELGLRWKNYDIFWKNIHKNGWIVIISWPTGSGKTTTLYSVLNSINDGKKKIITLEDPIEYQLPWIEQSQINESKWYTYELGLKSALRHDPDIILVWETRTLETANTAINASLTWHLVFTTLHTNAAIESISRLLNMWIKTYMLAPSLQMISSQRLLRKLDPKTMTWRDATQAESTEISEAIKKIKDANPKIEMRFEWKVPQAVPTSDNNMTWYKWRIAVMEILDVNDDIKELLMNGRNEIDIYTKARENGFITMKEDAIMKMLDGITTLEEIRRVL